MVEENTASILGAQTRQPANMFLPVGEQAAGVDAPEDGDEGRSKIVDEIESYCMNCGENVG